jgi:hypothetical protein
MPTLTAAAATLCLLLPAFVCAQSRPEFHISRAVQTPKIDGDLNDPAWNGDALDIGSWISYNPLYGAAAAHRTEVRILYDDRNLYFAFHCFDSEPEKIRTTISRRDNAFNDDWVGLSLDSSGTGQTSYHLFVNPSGIQMDAINTPSSGERFEADLVWYSAGKITDDGYSIEIRLPLQSIRFQSGKDVTMGILFWRRVSRMGMSWSWPDIPPGQWVFNRHAQIVFPELVQPRLLELLPSITYSISQLRATPNSWNDARGNADIGLSAKYGITSTMTLDATINPDFSQVESDAFQVQVNQRFPVFFSEKRPFFMEGMGLFNLAGTGGDGNMVSSVHTRKIIDPSWGSKLTGNRGRFTFGILSASDDNPEDIGDRKAAVTGRHKLFTIARMTYGLGESDYAGAIFTDTEHAGRSNRVQGGDLSIRFTRRQQFSATFLESETTANAGSPARGTAEQVSYNFNDRKYGVSTQIEHYGKDFQMDTAFYNRTGFTSGWGYGELNFYSKDSNQSALKRINLFTWNKYGRDQVQDGNERFSLVGVRLNFTRQGFIRVDQGWGREAWAGRRFNSGGRRLQGQAQFLRWLNLNGYFNDGWGIYYDPANPFQGRLRSSGIGFTLQPNPHVNQKVSYNRVQFDKAADATRVYLVHIVNLRSTYQFSRHFLVRFIEQFDSSQRRFLTDVLASYELVPGTVFHVGYGSLLEKRDFTEYLTTSRGLFLKGSYLHRFSE